MTTTRANEPAVGTAPKALLETFGIKKRFGAVEALRGIDLRVRPGETIALVGDNGAGKSTLVKILAGALTPSEGEIRFNGKPVSVSSTDEARELGIEAVYQDLGLCENLNVAQNIFLGRELTRRLGPFSLLDKRKMYEVAYGVLRNLSVNAPRARSGVSRLSGGQRQAVALARARMWERNLVLLDEPTAALGVQESQRAVDMIRGMQDHGLAVVLIAHNIPLVLQLSQRVVVLRHGKKVGDVRRAKLTADDVVALITGARDEWIEE